MEEVTVDECIELAEAIERQRALKIVEAVKAEPIGGVNSDNPKAFHAGYQLACDEIEHRLRTERWELSLPVECDHDKAITCSRCNDAKNEADSVAAAPDAGLGAQRAMVQAQLDDAVAALQRYSRIKGVRRSDVAQASIGPTLLKKRLDDIDTRIAAANAPGKPTAANELNK